jgi:hypothetical protein
MALVAVPHARLGLLVLPAPPPPPLPPKDKRLSPLCLLPWALAALVPYALDSNPALGACELWMWGRRDNKRTQHGADVVR